MSGRAFDPHFLYMWPNARIAVMGGEQAANVLAQVKKGQDSKEEQTKQLKALKQEILDKYEKESSSYYSSSRLWDDGIIDPADTRKIVGLSLAISINKQFPEPKTGVYRM